MLNETTTDIRKSTRITGTLNAPQGHVSAKTVGSVELIEWGLQRLFCNLNDFNYQAANLLSCMMLDVENCHSAVHIKVVQLAKMLSKRSLLKYFNHFVLISNIIIL